MVPRGLVLLTLALCSAKSATGAGYRYIELQQSGDGETYYENALPCTIRSFYRNNPYNKAREDYTPRNDVKCCYASTTRNLCCQDTVYSGGVQSQLCRCSPAISCGLSGVVSLAPPTTPPTTQPPTTTTTSTTTTTPTTTTTTTSTTTSTSTPAPFKSLCADSFRLLNGQAVTDVCQYKGVGRIIITNVNTPDTPVTCNFVYVNAPVNGTTQPTLLTHKFCKDSVKFLLDGGSSDIGFQMVFGSQRLPIANSLFDFADGTDGSAYITPKPVFTAFQTPQGPCEGDACPYNAATMAGDVDTTDCKMVSYGSSNVDSSQNGLNEAAVQLNPSGCAAITDTFGNGNSQCYTSTSGLNLACTADHGAPIYCKAQSNGEYILMGITAFQNSCDTSPDIFVVPVQ